VKLKAILICVIIIFGITTSAVGGTEKDLKKLPGYVDFEALDIFGEQEAKIEVYLKEDMLKLVSKFVEDEDEELFGMLTKLRLVRVQVFDVDNDLAEKFAARSSKTVKELDKKGWERIVRVNEDEEMVYVYLKPSKEYEYLDGIVVIVIDDDEAVFVNIVGEIHPDSVNRLGYHFGIDELDDDEYDYHIKKRKRN
jgi:hypothetical protein